MEKAGTSGEKETSAAASSGLAIEKQRMPSTDGDGESLTSVRAQVMAWDDRYGGWLPLEGGGLSTVTLYQRLVVRSTSDPTDETVADTSEPVVKVEYIVRGERLEDKKATLYCQLTKDISYRQVMPTFHHWQIEENKFGLKFMSSYEACEFHNRLQKAIEHLHRQSKSSSDDSNLEAEDLDDDVFVPVELPLSRAESWESGSTSRSVPTATKSKTTVAGPSTSLLHKPYPSYSTVTVPAIVHQPKSMLSGKKRKAVPSGSAALMPPAKSELTLGLQSGRTKTWPKSPGELTLSTGQPSAAASTSTTPAYRFPSICFHKDIGKSMAYLKSPAQYSDKIGSKLRLQPSSSSGQLTSHFGRPMLPGRSSALEKRESVGSLKLSLIHQQLPLPSISSTGISSLRYGGSRRTTKSGTTGQSPLGFIRRERCLYCKTYYVERDNRPGVCPDAPDPIHKWLRRLTCVWCAECVLYCCCRDWSDGEGQRDVCSCSSGDTNRGKRWTILALLSLIVPCLWCYPPIAACHHHCRDRWRLFGGRHVPVSHDRARQSVGSTTGRITMTPEPSSIYK